MWEQSRSVTTCTCVALWRSVVQTFNWRKKKNSATAHSFVRHTWKQGKRSCYSKLISLYRRSVLNQTNQSSLRCNMSMPISSEFPACQAVSLWFRLSCSSGATTLFDRNSTVKQIGRATEGGSTARRQAGKEAGSRGGSVKDKERARWRWWWRRERERGCAGLYNISRMVFGMRQGAEPSITPSV